MYLLNLISSLFNESTLSRQIHEEYRYNPFEKASIKDLGDIPIENTFNITQTHEEIRRYYRHLRTLKIIPLSIGGDHSITAPLVDGLIDAEPIGLIHIDAHTDTWDGVWGSDLHHGGPFRLLHQWGKIDKNRVIQIGIRGAQNNSVSWDYSKQQGFRVIFMHEFVQRSIQDIIEETKSIVGTGKVYLSFDIDGICPSFAPGTGTPEYGGLTPRESIQLLRGFRGLNFIGADLVEVAPSFDITGNTALLGATLMYEQLCLLVDGMNYKKK